MRAPRRSRHFSYLKADKFKNRIDTFSGHMKELEYTPYLLLARNSGKNAFEMLVDVVARLGPPTSLIPQEPRELTPKQKFDGHRMRAELAISEFSKALNPDCWTAYYRDRTVNRTSLLATQGLRFPEAMHGFVWSSTLTNSVLLDDSTQLVYLPTAARYANGANFTTREGFPENRVLGIRLAWDFSKVGLFVSWRITSHDVNREGENANGWTGFWKQADELSKIADSNTRTAALRNLLRPLELAVRYFNGWLLASGIDLSASPAIRYKANPDEIVRGVWLAARSSLKDKKGATGPLVSAIDRVLDLAKKNVALPFTSVHWTNDRPIVLNNVSYDPGKVLQFSKGSFEGYRSSPRVPLVLNHSKLVDKSICALSLTWRQSLLISDLDRKLRGSDGLTWRRLSIPRRDVKTISELSVPFFDGTANPLGVINVEHDSINLDDTHLHRAELVAHMFEAFHRFVCHDKSRRDQKLLADLWNRCPNHPAVLLKRLSALLRTKLAADIAYTLVYDARARVFVPLGVDCEQGVIDRFTTDELSKLVGKDVPKCLNDAEVAIRRTLIEYAVGLRLIPRRRGSVWRCFVKSVPICIADTKDNEELPLATRYYARTILMLPFRRSSNAPAEGVTIATWLERPETLESESKTAGFVTKCRQESEIYIEMFASVYTLARYLDPELGSDALPFLHTPE